MSTIYHTKLTVADALTIPVVNSRLSDLDRGIADLILSSAVMKIAHLYDQKATTVNGGASSATTWQTRTLNTENDPGGIVVLSSNQFTPVAGTYVIIARAPSYNGDSNRLRLYNETQDSVVFVGQVNFSQIDTLSELFYVFTADGEDAYRIDHYTQTAQADYGLGRATSDGENETYASVMLIQV